MAICRSLSTRASRASQSTAVNSRALAAHARVRQQVGNQLLHALGAIGGKGDILIGLGIEFTLVAPGQQLSRSC